MLSRRAVTLTLVVAVAGAAGYAGLGYGAGEAPPANTPELVATYSELATAILADKRAETAVVKAICAEAYHMAMVQLRAAAMAVGRDAASCADHAERAAVAVGLLANEGDKAVAAVRNRLLEGGHHHHATAEIAKKYPPGFVVIEKTEQIALMGIAKEIGKMSAAAKGGTASAADFQAMMQKLLVTYQGAVK